MATTLSFSKQIYSDIAAQKAAYKFTDRVSLCVSETDTHWVITLNPLSKNSEVNLDELAGHIQNEMLDQNLRQIVAAETADVRKLILAYAFSRSGLVEP